MLGRDLLPALEPSVWVRWIRGVWILDLQDMEIWRYTVALSLLFPQTSPGEPQVPQVNVQIKRGWTKAWSDVDPFVKVCGGLMLGGGMETERLRERWLVRWSSGPPVAAVVVVILLFAVAV